MYCDSFTVKSPKFQNRLNGLTRGVADADVRGSAREGAEALGL
jgi:hypothetical protein